MTPELRVAIANVSKLAEVMDQYGDVDNRNAARDLRLLIAALNRPKRQPAPKSNEPRPRNVLLDTLAQIEGHKLNEVTPQAWSRMAKALKEIKSVAPELTPAELTRRAGVYRQKWPERDLTANALAVWWGACNSVARSMSGTPRIADNLRR